MKPLCASLTLFNVIATLPLKAQWTQVTAGLSNSYVNALAVSGEKIFAGTRAGVFLPTNNGIGWSLADSGLTNNDVSALVFSGASQKTTTLNSKINCYID